jgi:hypothetical protein
VRGKGVLIGAISWSRGQGIERIGEIFAVIASETASGLLGSLGRDDRWASLVGDRRKGGA